MLIQTPGVYEFKDLADVPHSYIGQSLKNLRVNVLETGIDFAAPSGGGSEQAVIDVSTSQSIDTNQVVRGDATLASITLTLVNPATLQTVTIKKVDTSENSVYVTSPSLIDGEVTAELSTTDESITLKWTGSTYDII